MEENKPLKVDGVEDQVLEDGGNETTANYCPYCGIKVSRYYNWCPNCGQPLPK